MKASYTTKEKLKSKKQIEQLFAEGSSISSFPLRLVYMSTTNEDNFPVKTGVSVSKKHFKKAVDRNRIKRLLREAYRLHKNAFFNNITTHYALMILYIGNDMPSFSQVEKAMLLLLKKFSDKNPQ
ncbi:MAG: ribonuclease P protein component [Bacteroidia bacterium]|nr:ribonuclease P protein component [Bacteroidia bacterium]NND25765.1 ribonuclease P protein component [Flavobacteriaceae bacterium]MBT8277387.1 ribonuclease P protein component [Bacteroidia bacterium]NNK59705.1 ribonuclease P protein component [Flavobacteriaceae bacterium]NNL32270.1 ribonuclease P protein component [Flavobacteriaceae bacterium]